MSLGHVNDILLQVSGLEELSRGHLVGSLSLDGCLNRDIEGRSAICLKNSFRSRVGTSPEHHDSNVSDLLPSSRAHLN